MKTKEEILIAKFGEYQDIKQKPFPKIIEAMQEHTDQAITAYKLKLKEQFSTYGSFNTEEIFIRMDNTTI